MKSDRATVSPVLIGPGNAMAAIGAPWRWVRDTAEALGVPFIGRGRKRFVESAGFIAALKASGIEPGSQVVESEDPVEAMRLRVYGPEKGAAINARSRGKRP